MGRIGLVALVVSLAAIPGLRADAHQRPRVVSVVQPRAARPALSAEGPAKAVHLTPGAGQPALEVVPARLAGEPGIDVSGDTETEDGDAIGFTFAVTAGDEDLDPFTLEVEYSEGLSLGIVDPQGWACTFGAPGHASCEWTTTLPAGQATGTARLAGLAQPPYGGVPACDPGRSPCAFLRATLAGVATGVWTAAVIVGGNHAPVAADDTAAVPSPPAPAVIDVLGNDTDADGDALAVTIVAPPSHGTAAVDAATQRVVYTPGPGFPGSDSFRYRVTDPDGASATALVVVAQLSGSVAFQSPVTDVGNIEPGKVAFRLNYLQNTTGLELLGTVLIEPVDAAEFPALLAGTPYDPGQAVSDVSVFSGSGSRIFNGAPSSPFSVTCRLNPPLGRVWLARVKLTLRPTTMPSVVLEASYVVVARSAGASEVPVQVVDDVVDTPAGTPVLIHPLDNDQSAALLPLSVTGLAAAEPFRFEPPFMVGGVEFALGQGGGPPFLGALYTPPPGFAGATDFYYAASETPGGIINGRYDYARITVNVGGVHNHAPVLAPMANLTVPELAMASFTATATDPDGDVLAFSLVGAPAGAQIDSGTGRFTWLPSEAQGPGTYTFSVRVTDPVSFFDEKTVTIAVTEVNAAPALALPPLRVHIWAGALFPFTATATDPDVPAQALTFSLAGAPAGARIDPASGAFAWTPGAADVDRTFTFAVVVTDSGSPAASAQRSVTVRVVAVIPAVHLLVSGAPDRSTAQPLSSSLVGRLAYIFVSPSSSVTRVRFWLDDPARTGPPRQVENAPPFDFAGTAPGGSALAFDTRGVPNGVHSVLAEVTLAGGRTETLFSTFGVVNTAPVLLVSTSPNRSNPRPLGGAALRNNAYVFVQPDPDAVRIRFWLDAPRSQSPRHVETATPFDFAGTAANGNAAPFDARSVQRGPHVIRAIVDYAGASVATSATFLVDR
jgi:hypothetical protein